MQIAIPSDVYVKFVPEEEMRLSVVGTTNVSQVENDQHAYDSEYGSQTVSVKIMIGKKALWVLAHELGHVKYQVPHLASYANYYIMLYQHAELQSSYIGHNPNDGSGQHASMYEKRFSKHYIRYIKSSKDQMIKPLALLQDIKGSLLTQ